MNRVKIYWVNFTSEIYELRIRNQMSERAAFFFHAFQKWEGKVHVHKPFNLTYYILVYFYFLCYFPAEKCVSTAMTGALNYKRNETKNETEKKEIIVFYHAIYKIETPSYVRSCTAVWTNADQSGAQWMEELFTSLGKCNQTAP